MTTQEVKERIGEHRWEAFLRWMEGQTVGMYENGETNWFEDDVERFVEGLPVID